MIKRGLILAAALAVSTVALGHHSFAMFDMAHVATMHGRVRTLEWTNPHVWVWVDRYETSGEPAAFGFELASPAEITRNYGWAKTSVKVGDEVTVEYAPLRSGKNGGALVSIKLPNGQVLYGTAHNVIGASSPSTNTQNTESHAKP